MKTKILIDLDVVTVSIWDKKGESVKAAVTFIDKVKRKEFWVVTPFASMNIDDKKIIEELTNNRIKGEDSLLVLVASVFDVDYLVTFNRAHLRNKKNVINEVLKKNDLRTIGIIGPEEA